MQQVCLKEAQSSEENLHTIYDVTDVGVRHHDAEFSAGAQNRADVVVVGEGLKIYSSTSIVPKIFVVPK